MKYPYDWDLEWLAVDLDGSIAVFTTGGRGPLPIKGYEEYSREEFSDTVWELPKTSSYELLVDLPRPDDYIQLSEKGFFTYDWADVHRVDGKHNRYELQSRPTKPLKLDKLPSIISDVVRSIVLPIRFTELSEVDVSVYIECCHA